MLELRNDSDQPLVAILEVRGFSVDVDGNLKYEPADPGLRVELGSNSFTIPPRQSHYVFYKASSKAPSAWFAILNTLTRAVHSKNQMRLNFILPHVVYIYQKQKLTKQDVRVQLRSAEAPGKYQLEIENTSGKLGRVIQVDCRGFETELDLGGLPVFPHGKRRLSFSGGTALRSARVILRFQDGFTVEARLETSEARLETSSAGSH
jgi:hypothetical protein